MPSCHFKVFVGLLLVGTALVNLSSANALPPPDDLPEEYLRNQIIFEARSPLTGEVLTAAEYAEFIQSIEEDLRRQENAAVIKPEYKNLLFLLQLRKLLRTFGVPFP